MSLTCADASQGPSDLIRGSLDRGEHLILFGAGPNRAAAWLDHLRPNTPVIVNFDPQARHTLPAGPVVTLHDDAWPSPHNENLASMRQRFDGWRDPHLAVVLIGGPCVRAVLEWSSHSSRLIWLDDDPKITVFRDRMTTRFADA